ncbi:tapasin-related protein isoform X1 [Oryzias melastigma]|uniref:TAP binding protein like n=1 Tax=Oryzias melastigma TaxID=30732 RepID=A0A3B3DH64_ORYME|nr:tapasin-related protein isoform X1 [Oryzias melastigma]
MMIEIFFFGLFITWVHADGAADVVLSCALVEEGSGLSGMGGGGLFTRTPATLVFRDVAVGPDEPLEMLSPFVPPSVPDPELFLFEASVTSPDIPNADRLLHADCNELEVMCEVSRYSSKELQDSSDQTFFMVSITVEELDFSISLILETLPVEKTQSTLMQSKLNLPLSQSGTLLTKAIFVVFSNSKTLSAPLRGDVLLDCSFKQQEVPIAHQVDVEWRLQHRGKGWKVLDLKTTLDDTEGVRADVNVERKGSSMNAGQVVSEGNVSLSLSTLKVADEGTYICTVSIGHFHAQQVIQLHVIQPPHVSLSEEKLILKTPQTLKCYSSKYYPLDAQIEWLFVSPAATEPELFKDQGSLTSHRQHGDGTFSLSSLLTVPPTVPPGTRIICRVSHVALGAPLDISLLVETPKIDSYWWFLGFLIVTVIFFFQVIK